MVLPSNSSSCQSSLPICGEWCLLGVKSHAHIDASIVGGSASSSKAHTSSRRTKCRLPSSGHDVALQEPRSNDFPFAPQDQDAAVSVSWPPCLGDDCCIDCGQYQDYLQPHRNHHC
ncbi:unnamed protein product, partial [Amoebophrya sp. A120]|eukprot:GSA120T00020053001.1